MEMDAWKWTQFKVISLFSNASVQIFDESHWFWSRFCGFRSSILIISRQRWLFAFECLYKRLNIDCFMFSYFQCQQYSFIRTVWHLLWFKNDESIDLLFVILLVSNIHRWKLQQQIWILQIEHCFPLTEAYKHKLCYQMMANYIYLPIQQKNIEYFMNLYSVYFFPSLFHR